MHVHSRHSIKPAHALAAVLLAHDMAPAVSQSIVEARTRGLGGSFSNAEPADAVDADAAAAAAADDDNTFSSSYSCKTFVECDGGFVKGEGTLSRADDDAIYVNGDSSAVTCHDRCAELGGNCCVDAGDCGFCEALTFGTNCTAGFTGKVCADDGQKSCDGRGTGSFESFQGACVSATISEVIDGCQGLEACAKMTLGGNGLYQFSKLEGGIATPNEEYLGLETSGTVGAVRGSCWGREACSFMAALGGQVSFVEDSCREDLSCRFMAYQGTGVGTVAYSCNALGACDICEDDTCSDGPPSKDPSSGVSFTAILNGSCNSDAACRQYLGTSTSSPVLVCGCPGASCPKAPFSKSVTKCLLDAEEGAKTGVCAGDAAECIASADSTSRFRVRMKRRSLFEPSNIRTVSCRWIRNNPERKCNMRTFTQKGRPRRNIRVRDLCVTSCEGF
mmetsp:Transcript_24774/g.71571  ORF Transcript_24774/g.71571 Transcript_24774/m.71571 type:complete len:447 (-) Transcript_24774:94-1434(-)